MGGYGGPTTLGGSVTLPVPRSQCHTPSHGGWDGICAGELQAKCSSVSSSCQHGVEPSLVCCCFRSSLADALPCCPSAAVILTSSMAAVSADFAEADKVPLA